MIQTGRYRNSVLQNCFIFPSFLKRGVKGFFSKKPFEFSKDYLMQYFLYWSPPPASLLVIDVQTGGTARPSPSPFEPGPFEPDLLIGPGRAARRAGSSVRARHYTGPSVPGRPGKPGPRRSPAQPEHAK
jgi:hypothetical protein